MDFLNNFTSNIPLLGTTITTIGISIVVIVSLKKTIKLGLNVLNVLSVKYKKYKIQLEELLKGAEGQQDKYDVLLALDQFTESLCGLLRSIKAPKQYILFFKNLIEESDYKRLK